MAAEIARDGPVEAVFSVYEDFMAYQGGVYVWSGAGRLLGQHAVKLLGWGSVAAANGTRVPYWIAANSWNRSTGAVEQQYTASVMQKRKHQINSLAAEAAERSVEFAQRRGSNFKTKAETQAKYGW